jgi:hypothetical protein
MQRSASQAPNRAILSRNPVSAPGLFSSLPWYLSETTNSDGVWTLAPPPIRRREGSRAGWATVLLPTRRAQEERIDARVREHSTFGLMHCPGRRR